MRKTVAILVVLCLASIRCTNSKSTKKDLAIIKELQFSLDSLKTVLTEHRTAAEDPIITFLTFQDNNAETAMNFYVEVFENSEIIAVQRWGKDGPGEEGRIMQATFALNGNQFMCSDSPPIHDWDFSPAVSNYLECENESELEELFSKLSEKGSVPLPLGNYGFSQKFGWVIDQFGVSWQLNLR
ncbi:MAG: VOC family protein [Bacteroidota bacterium]